MRGTLAQLPLALPKDPLLPESLGFPKMFTAMTFPSPPTASRPPSQGMKTSHKASYQRSAIDAPTVRPRSSSIPSRASNGASTHPVDEVLMQPGTPMFRYSEPNEASPVSPVSGKSTTSKTMACLEYIFSDGN
ncbi:hypothetical protein F5Y05DRAFT_252671 [Hypoxylon sp. FL0543]|nr:hypothetical protein F5Y05DRAFT_252671 [Hypoxylon sp. FL0543]